MRNRFDQLGKKIGLSALGPSGLTVAHDEIAPDAHHADLRHEPDPARHAERARLGLLGRLASIVCLIEIYSDAPDEDDALACLGKLIAFRQRRRRDAKKDRSKRPPAAEPFLRPFVWIIAAGRPKGVLTALAGIPAPSFPPGVFFSPGVLLDKDGRTPLAGLEGAGGLCRIGIVVASELPRDRSTLLVRLMAGGPLLPGALADLSALPDDAHEHAVASQILLGLQRGLGKTGHHTTEEQEFIVGTQNIVERLVEKGRREGRKEARKEAREEAREEARKEVEEARKIAEGMAEQTREEGRLVQARAAVRRVLAVRKIAPSRADKARIDGCSDLATLERWLDRALVARSAAEALQGVDSKPRDG